MSELSIQEERKLSQTDEQPRSSGLNTFLWLLVAAFAILIVLQPFMPSLVFQLCFVLIIFVFSFVHGSRRYGIRGSLVFLVIALVVSNVMENVSITTGFFGHYYFTFGPKLFFVPLSIGFIYFCIGYVSWTVANILLGQTDTRLDRRLNLVALPIISTFIMVMWDVVVDPTYATIKHLWIWQNGGGYFGVPLSNYLGFSLVVYLPFQLFALYLSRRIRPLTALKHKGYWYQPILFYLLVSLACVVLYLAANQSGHVVDPTGGIWNVHDISETSVIISLYTMDFVAVLAFIKLMTAPQTEKQLS